MGVDGYLTIKEAAAALGVSEGRVRQLVKRGQLDGVKVGGVMHVTPPSVQARIERKPRAGNPGLSESRNADVPDGYVSSGDAARALRVSSSRVSALIADGMLEGKKVGGRYVVSRDSLVSRILGEEPERSAREFEERGGYMNLTQAAEALGITKGRLSTLIKEGKMKAVKEGKGVIISVDEVERRKAENPGPGNPMFGPGYHRLKKHGE